MRILIDEPNILWRSLSVGTDPEGIRAKDPETGKDIVIPTAEYGFENALQLLSSALTRYNATPKDLVFVGEARNPQGLRKRKVPGTIYKDSRGKRQPRAYSEFQRCREMLEEFFLELGAACCVQDEVEADDILAFLAQHAEEDVMVFSHDGDMCRIVGKNPKGAMVHVGNNDALDVNPYGPFPNDLITLYKALVGDVNDTIKGAPGFGKKSFLNLLGTYGVEGLSKIEELVVARQLHLLNEQAESDRTLKLIVNNEQSVYDSHTLALLYPDAVDTASRPLKWRYGMVRDRRPDDDRRFAPWYGNRTLVHAGNYRQMVKWAAEQPTPFVALDLETTTSEESDEWMEARKTRDSEAGIDVLGSEIVSCGLTFGDNLQHTIYLTHRHDTADGVQQLTLNQLAAAIQHVTRGKRVVAHNAGGFELPVLRNHIVFEGDEEGFLPGVHCTKLLASYVDENQSSGLKSCAKLYLGYDQQTYAEVTGGKKMDELTATHVFHYGTDDTIVTAALYNHFTFRCQTEDTWSAYCEVEPVPMYLQAAAFLEGVPISLERMREIEIEDDATYERAWATLRDFLISKGWAGTVCPVYTPEITAKEVKDAFLLIAGRDLDTKVRTPSKLVSLIEEEEGGEILAQLLHTCLAGDPGPLNDLVKAHFDGEPKLNLNSPKQLASLLYETLALPVRLRNDATDKMKEKGIFEGNPSTDDDALKMALHYDKGGAHPEVLKAILELKTVETRRKMFYRPYRAVEHWKDRLVHASFNQCATVTRRYSCSGPNLQQLPKKDEGLKFREIILPHHKDAVVVSMDFSGQELRLLAEDSQDPALLECYVGDNLKDLHSITGAAISEDIKDRAYSYDEVVELEGKGDPIGKSIRAMGKKLNFTVSYGAMAPKVALTLMIEEAVAQRMLEARAAIFAVSEQWKKDYIAKCRELGYATTHLGARRHLRNAFDSDDFRVASKAERQGPNFRIQGSGAEMTKLAMKRMWERRIFSKFDAVPYGPVHDEYVASCAIRDLPQFLKEMHACMVDAYADMKVPIISSISFGPSFGVQIEIGEQPTDEAIEYGLSTLAQMAAPAAKQAA